MMFDDVLERKERFLDTVKQVKWFSWKIWNFFWELINMILVKNLKLVLSLFFSERGLDMMLDDVLPRKKGFLDYENVVLP